MSDKPLTMHPFESAIVRTLEADNARLTAEVEKLRSALQWQPIETAPKDGTRVTLLIPPYGAGSGHWSGERWIGHFVLNREAQPTHWMHPPSPPALKEENSNDQN